MLILAVYTKPAALYLVVFPVLFLIFAKREYLRAAIFAMIFVLALVPWMARNASLGGSFVMTSDDTGNICGWTLHGVLATKYGVDPTDWTTTWNLPEFLQAKEKCTSSFAALRLFFTEYPTAFLKTMTLSSLSLLTNDGYSVFFEKSQNEQIKPHHNFLTPAVFAMRDAGSTLSAALREFSAWELGIILGGKFFWTAVFFMAMMGSILVLRLRYNGVQGLFILCIALYFISVTIFVTAYGAGARLRYPITPYMIILAAFGMKWFYEKARKSSSDVHS
ncbi:MAG: hypothetical protein G01um101470_442 [Parcubacteria group bacterium Gr01-1014_70]|nr:MAG: hypothetical protein G01um101470_442 [Parcubacteria group bacterium Gr01-1014_70]